MIHCQQLILILLYYLNNYNSDPNSKTLKEKETKTEGECGESVYVFGSFTYGAKLWPACLAVSEGRAHTLSEGSVHTMTYNLSFSLSLSHSHSHTLSLRLFLSGIIRDTDLFKGKSVLDVGCGVGLASLTAAAIGVREREKERERERERLTEWLTDRLAVFL